MGIDVFHDLNHIQRKLSDSNLSRANRAVTNNALNRMQPYVPKDTGALRSLGRVVDDETIEWNGLVYGPIQYHTQFQNYTTPGTGPYWDMVASGNHMNEWEQTYLRGLGL